jgi:carbonic anhydrase
MRVHTKETQSSLTPRMALEILKEGNERFINNLKIKRDLLGQVNATRDGQWPFACILSCIDSRTSSELIFDQGLGDIFSVRIAGNIVNTDILGSMEFACKVAGSKLILVLGHSKCGAVKGGQRNSENAAFVENVASINVRRAVKSIIERSFIIEQMVEHGKLGVVGAMYNIDTGKVEFYDDVEYIKDEHNPDFTVEDLKH